MKYTEIIKKCSFGLLDTYKNTLSEHPGTKGAEREQSVIDFLTKIMPRKYGFKSGEVFDKKGSMSGQIDIIIYDTLYSSVIENNKNIISPIESTYGIISVKSKMGTKELDNAIEGIKKYDGLERPRSNPNEYYIDPDTCFKAGDNISIPNSYQRNINCIFAFGTNVNHETIVKKVRDAGCVDLLVIPEELIVLGRLIDCGQININGKLLEYYLKKSENSIVYFSIILQEYLRYNKLIRGSNLGFLSELFSEPKL